MPAFSGLIPTNKQTNEQTNKQTNKQNKNKNKNKQTNKVVDRLSLQSGKVYSGKLERIFPSINFSSEFSRIHAKKTQKPFDPTKAKCCKLVEQRGKTRSSTFLALNFLWIFNKRHL